MILAVDSPQIFVMVHIVLAFLAILGTYLHIKLAEAAEVSIHSPAQYKGVAADLATRIPCFFRLSLVRHLQSDDRNCRLRVGI